MTTNMCKCHMQLVIQLNFDSLAYSFCELDITCGFLDKFDLLTNHDSQLANTDWPVSYKLEVRWHHDHGPKYMHITMNIIEKKFRNGNAVFVSAIFPSSLTYG